MDVCDEKDPVARPTATYTDICTEYCSFGRVSQSQAIESDQWIYLYSPTPIDIPNTASIIVESRQGLTGIGRTTCHTGNTSTCLGTHISTRLTLPGFNRNQDGCAARSC
jgi:hypothetical protein